MIIFKVDKKIFFFSIFIGVGFFLGIISFFPDGKLRIIFCDVGQGDGIYIRMPNNTDMLIDGGPSNRVLDCLGKNMPFYDRTITAVMMTHPQKDHYYGLIEVLSRYEVKYLITVPVTSPSEDFKKFTNLVYDKNLPIKYVFQGDRVDFGNVSLTILWPDKKWLKNIVDDEEGFDFESLRANQELGFITDHDPNAFSIYAHLRFEEFDLLFTGDGEDETQKLMKEQLIKLPQVEVLKVPHHGSKKAFDSGVVEELEPQLSIIQVGKNSYGHPHIGTVDALESNGSQIIRTDVDGEIVVVSDGKTFIIK